jgi:hypothetical protein
MSEELREIDDVKMSVVKLEGELKDLRQRQGMIERMIELLFTDKMKLTNMVIDKYKEEKRNPSQVTPTERAFNAVKELLEFNRENEQ